MKEHEQIRGSQRFAGVEVDGTKTNRPPFGNEPYCPPCPPRTVTEWSNEEWQVWWVQLVRWCMYRSGYLGEEVRPLSPPPSREAPASDWDDWWSEFLEWGYPVSEQARVMWPPYPDSWREICVDESISQCRICAKEFDTGLLRMCRSCGNIVCRECLYLSQDHCPCCAND